MIITNKDTLEADLELCKLVLNGIGAYVSIKDKNKKYVYANQKLETFFEDDFDSIIGCADYELLDFSNHANLIESDNRVLDFGDCIENEDIVIIKSTGEKRVYLSSKQPIYNINKDIVGVLCVAADITKMHFVQERLEIEATTDPLTGLFNRRFFFKLADKFLSESIRHNKSLSLIMLDIDLFKEINDKYGHPIGDQIIQFVASKAKNLLRKEDIIARVGGEEYVVLLPNTDGKSALLIAEKIRLTIDSQCFKKNSLETIYPKISLGVATYTEGDSEFHEIYARSDKALYQAKFSGRNKSCILEKL